jgi:ABC-type nickel/cobalt efflux system permease component RcnA
MSGEIAILAITSASIALFHTLLGPDHYIPFIVMAKARKWSLSYTSLITFLCGIGHVAGSIILGMVGVALGVAVSKIQVIESFRGDLAAWAFIAFGLIYFAWGMKRAYGKHPHTHSHSHIDVHDHDHGHIHKSEHAHPHVSNHNVEKANITPWVLFTIFVLGPCEPLIPIVMLPAARNSLTGYIASIGVFALITIITMLSVVIVSYFGIKMVKLNWLERFSHAMAGAAICFSGLAIVFLGL